MKIKFGKESILVVDYHKCTPYVQAGARSGGIKAAAEIGGKMKMGLFY